MEPYRYLEKVASALDSLDDPEEIGEILDELEFLYEALEPELQGLATDLIARLSARLKSLR